MAPDEWLAENGKKPFELSGFYYWGTMDDYDPNDPSNEPDEEDFLLPNEVFLRLKAKTTYPNVKLYLSEQEALDDFRQAFA